MPKKVRMQLPSYFVGSPLWRVPVFRGFPLLVITCIFNPLGPPITSFVVFREFSLAARSSLLVTVIIRFAFTIRDIQVLFRFFLQGWIVFK